MAQADVNIEQIHEYHDQLDCFLCTCKYTCKRVLEYTCIRTDIAREARLEDPKLAFSAILRNFSRAELERVPSLQYMDNKRKIFVHGWPVKDSINIDDLDTILIRDFLFHVPAFPSCSTPYVPLQTSIVNHMDGSHCACRKVCCALCLTCVRCFSNACAYRNQSKWLSAIVKIRNKKAHMEFSEYEEIKQAKMNHSNVNLVSVWENDLMACKAAVTDLLTMMTSYITKSVCDQKLFEIDLVLRTAREIYRPHFTKEYEIYHGNTKIEINFKCAAKNSKKLEELGNLNHQNSQIIRANVGLHAQEILQNALEGKSMSKPIVIKLNAFKFHPVVSRNITFLTTVLNINADKDELPESYNDSASPESAALLSDLTKVFADIVNKTLQAKVEVTCNGWEFHSIHIYFGISLPEETSMSKIVIKDILRDIPNAPSFCQTLRKHGLCYVKMTIVIDKKGENVLTIGFNVLTFNQNDTDTLQRWSPEMKERFQQNIWQKIADSTLTEDVDQITVDLPPKKRPRLFSSLYRFIQRNDPEGLRISLLKSPQTINMRSDRGATLLHLAVKHRKLTIVKLLLELGCNTWTEDDFGNWNAYHRAANDGCIECLHTLLNHDDTHVNNVTEDGQTPLHLASSNGHVECVKLLLSHGIDTSVKNVDGETAFDVAGRSNEMHATTIQELIADKR